MAKPSVPIIVPVVLSGGSGTRLWPLSLPARPKQFLSLSGAGSLFQETVQRVHGAGFGPPLVIGNQEHRFLIAEQLRELGIASRAVVLEPEGRNTAPAVAVAALMLSGGDSDALMLVLPSDHVIRKAGKFLAAVRTARAAAAQGAFVTFGVAPDRPHIGYGYIKKGKPVGRVKGCARVARFVEKPDLKTARAYLKDGGYFWNAGIFLLSARAYLAELEKFAPKVLKACRAAVAKGTKDLDFFRLDPKSFAASPAGSIDVTVMERTGCAAVVPVNMGWTDAGSWSALWESGAKDRRGNVRVGPVVTHDVAGSYLRSEGLTLGVVGLGDVVVVVTEDAVLVAPKDRAEDVRALAASPGGKAAADGAHVTVHRPWGSFKTLRAGERYQVKQITVKPGAALSLQYHRRRAEHWVVVAGRAKVWRGDEVFFLNANESTYIPVGTKHRLQNVGDGLLHIIEVQSGDYLGEDDIVRLEDLYGRT